VQLAVRQRLLISTVAQTDFDLWGVTHGSEPLTGGPRLRFWTINRRDAKALAHK